MNAVQYSCLFAENLTQTNSVPIKFGKRKAVATKGLGWLHLVNNGRSVSKSLSVVIINREQTNEFKELQNRYTGYIPTVAVIRSREQFYLRVHSKS